MSSKKEPKDLRIKHQLMVHFDYHPTHKELQIRYSYPFSREHELREQLIRYEESEIPVDLRNWLSCFSQFMADRIPQPETVRLPHAEVRPDISYGYLTVVVQDQSRANKVPLARLYYYEEVKPLSSKIEKQVYSERPNFNLTELDIAKRIREAVRKIAWKAYSELVGEHLMP